MPGHVIHGELHTASVHGATEIAGCCVPGVCDPVNVYQDFSVAYPTAA